MRKNNSTTDVIQEFSGTFKTHKAEGCSLFACYSLKNTKLQRSSRIFSDIFKKPFKNLIRSSFLLKLQPVDFSKFVEELFFGTYQFM